MAVKLYVYNDSRERIGEVRSISSLQWLEQYRDAGELKLVCGATENNIRLLTCGARLINADRPHLVAVVDTIEQVDDDKKSKLTVRAEFSVAAWEWRTVMYTETVTNAEEGMLRIAANNQRGLACSIPQAQGAADEVDTQYTWGTVLDALRSLAGLSTLGFYSRVDAELNETLTVYAGVDRTVAGSAEYIGYLSLDARTLAKITTKVSDYDYRNVAIVCGQGEGADRRVVRVDLSDGAPAREIHIDARDIGAEYTVSNADGTTTKMTRGAAEQDAALMARGKEKLAEQCHSITVKADLRQTSILFGRDYDLGDVLPLVLDYPAKRVVAARIISVKIIYEQAKTIEATLEVSI